MSQSDHCGFVVLNPLRPRFFAPVSPGDNMGNGGWHGTDEEWDRVEALLILLDPELEHFARRHGLKVTKNSKDWPERSLRWGTDVEARKRKLDDWSAHPEEFEFATKLDLIPRSP